jgi:hypothetical protein
MSADKRELEGHPVIKTNTKAANSLTRHRLFNAGVGTLVLFQYMNTADANASEYLPDLFIHFFEAIAPGSCKDFAIVANTLRACQAGYGFFSGDSSISSAANFFDMFIHGSNIAQRMS